MKSQIRHFILTLIIVGVASFTFDAVAQTDESKPTPEYSIEQFLKTVSYGGSSFSPDKTKILVNNDRTGIPNVYSVSIADKKETQLTESKVDAIRSLGYFPDSERFLYTADQGGNELNHVYIRNLDGTTKDLTPGEKLKASFEGWSSDDKSFYVSTNERNEKYFDTYRYDAKTLERKLVFKNEDGYQLGAISNDGKKFALGKVANRNDSDTFLFDVDTGEIKKITEHTGDINYQPQDFSPDDKSLFLVTDKGHDFGYLVKYDLESGKQAEVFKTKWDVVGAGFSKKGNYFLVAVNEDSQTALNVFKYPAMTKVELPKIKDAAIGSFGMSSDEKHVAMYGTSGRMPSDLFYVDFEKLTEPKQLTRSLNEEISPEHLVDGKVVRFKSFDGLEVPGILFKPHQASAENKCPALVWVHGGPGGQSRIGYRGLIQYLVNHGYVVYAINNRGSSGYGKKFEQLDNRNHGKNDLMDCVSSKKMLIDTGYVDKDRIGIIGGSYGGYMTLAALTFKPDEFEVGVDIFGVANWHRTVQNIPPWWESMRESLQKELGDFNDEEYFKSISPLFHAKNIKKPLLVLQGANDPRVLKVESDEMVAEVKKNGVPCEYIIFDDEGHGFRKKENQLKGYKSILDFLDEYLKGEKPEK